MLVMHCANLGKGFFGNRHSIPFNVNIIYLRKLTTLLMVDEKGLVFIEAKGIEPGKKVQFSTNAKILSNRLTYRFDDLFSVRIQMKSSFPNPSFIILIILRMSQTRKSIQLNRILMYFRWVLPAKE
ncbi:MAG: hypothetical protein ACI8P9_001887 [Parasphingorhabdus sp.]|jgi:hypothetical protein